MSFRLKTILGIALIELILLSTMVFSSLDYLVSSNQEEFKRRADSMAALLATASTDAVLSTDLARLDQMVGEFMNNSDVVYVRVRDKERVLTELGDESFLHLSFKSNDSIQNVDDQVYDVSASIQVNQVKYGQVEIGLSIKSIEAIVKSASQRIVGLALLEMTLVAIFSWILGNYLTRQLADLEMAANWVAKDETCPPLRIRGNDELAKVANAFNRMTESIQFSYQRLQLSLSEIHDQREWLQALVNSGLDGLIAINTEGKITLFNPAAEKMFGYQADETLGHNVNMLMPEPHHTAHDQYLAKYLKTGIKHVIGIGREVMGRHKDGSTFFMDLSVTEFNSTKERGFIGIVRNITERKQLDEKLRSSENMKKAILEASLDAIITIDEHSRIVEFNQSASAIFGYSANEILGQLLSDTLIPQRYRVAHLEGLVNYISTGHSPILNQRIELIAIHKSGEEFPIEIAITTIVSNQHRFFTAFIRDISKIKQTEARINALHVELEQQNQNLLDSEGKLKKAQEVASLGSWFISFQPEILTWSDQCYQIFEVPLGTQVQLSNFADAIYPDDRVTVLDAWSAALKGDLFDIEHRLLVHGKIKWIRAKAEIKFDKNFQPIEAIGTVQDITELKLLEENLISESEKNQILLRNASDGIHILNLDGNVIEASDAFCNMLGYTYNEVIGMNAANWDGMFEKTELVPFIMQQYKDHQRIQFETFHVRKNGSRFPVEISGSPLKFKDQPLMFYSARDITKRNELDEGLRASENMKKTMFESSLDGVITLDAQGQIVEFNSSASAIFGYSTDEIIGQQIEKLFFETEYAIAIKDSINLFNETGNCEILGQRQIIEAIRKSGEQFSLEIAMIPISQNNEQFFVAFVRDITSSKRAEESLRLGREQAEQASLMKSQFLATMSHEIRTPLNAILGAQELLADTPLNEIQLDFLSLANDAGNNLVSLVNDILDFSKIEAGKLELENYPFKPVNIVNEVLKLLGFKAREKKLSLNCSIEDDSPTLIYGDPLRFRQVVMNLVSNAIKFTETGGVTIKLSNRSNSQSSNVLVLEVIDSGIGIAESIQPFLFELFMQADASDTRKFGGTGLGLAICKRLVELWGGEIGLESRLGDGSRFWFTFGGRIDNIDIIETDLSPTSIPNSFSSTIARLLLVEDSIANQVVISTVLRNIGHTVDIVDSGAGAIAAVQEHDYDLVFMDVSMPDMSGIEATRIIRKLEGNARNIPIVAMTAHAFKRYREQCLDAGMNDYATKPISKIKLKELVDRWVGGQAAELQLQNDNENQAENVLDEATLNSLAEDAELDDIIPLLRIFITELENRRKDIIYAIENQDIDKLRLSAHSLKSAAATFGAKALNALAVTTDNCCKQGDSTAALQEAKKLLVCAEITLTAFNQRCQSKPH